MNRVRLAVVQALVVIVFLAIMVGAGYLTLSGIAHWTAAWMAGLDTAEYRLLGLVLAIVLGFLLVASVLTSAAALAEGYKITRRKKN